MCASSTPDLHLSQAGSHKNPADASDTNASTSLWKDPMVISFTVVGVLFLLSVILGALNIYIWYIEKRNRRHHTGLERIAGGYGYTTNYESTSSKPRSTNLAFVFMGRGRQQGDNSQGNRGSKMARQTSVAGNR